MKKKKKIISIATLLQVSAILTSIPETIYGAEDQVQINPIEAFCRHYDALDAVSEDPLVPVVESEEDSTEGLGGERETKKLKNDSIKLQAPKRSARIKKIQERKVQDENKNQQNFQEKPSTVEPKSNLKNSEKSDQVAMQDLREYSFRSIWDELVAQSKEDAKVLDDLFPQASYLPSSDILSMVQQIRNSEVDPQDYSDLGKLEPIDENALL
jgi:hypothetical protein